MVVFYFVGFLCFVQVFFTHNLILFYILCFKLRFLLVASESYLNHHKSFLKFFAILKVQVIALDLLATNVL
jgi:hypothetical protein